MDNLKRPAYPQPLTLGSDGSVLTPWQHHEDFAGFTKLEKAALIIAQGMCSNSKLEYNNAFKDIPSQSVKLAKAVLEECNK